jgi:hypothetical protein
VSRTTNTPSRSRFRYCPRKGRQGRGGAHAHDIYVLGLDYGVHGLVEALLVQLLQRGLQLVHVGADNRFHDVPLVYHLAGHLDALHRGQAAAYHLLHGLAHGGVAVVAQLRREAHHGGFADAHRLAQTARRHERRLVVIVHDVFRYLPLALGEAGVSLLQHGQYVFFHVTIPFLK